MNTTNRGKKQMCCICSVNVAKAVHKWRERREREIKKERIKERIKRKRKNKIYLILDSYLLSERLYSLHSTINNHLKTFKY